MARLRPPLIAVSMGDPAGIGREVILRAAAALARRRSALRLVVVGDLDAMSDTARQLGLPAPFEWRRGASGSARRDGLAVLNLGRLRPRAMRPGHPSVEGADAAYRYILEGCRMALDGEAEALVTAPINKEWMNRAGHHFPGHSELLAKMCGVRLWRMMFAGTQLRVVLATVHIGLAQVARRLTREGVLDSIRLLSQHLERRLGVARPRIAVLGLNPHAGEHGLFGDEEARCITPAIRRARRTGIDAFGPLAPDTAFIRRGGRFGFDGVVAMYHDQGLIALKTLDFDRAVNITLGLPFIRTSPDHGTAYELAGRGEASAASMIAAIEYAAEGISAAAGRAPLRLAM
jgi:4-phospho-D-threonate 3-dehydrogenase / 4-phospho-D-erythronate 3-dehydrogenase